MVLSIIFLEDKHKMLLHLSIFYEYQHFFNTVSVSRYRYIYKLLTWVTLLNHAESVCFKSVFQSGRSLFLSKIKNTWLKLPVGVSPLQLVNLHRNRRYFVIKLHTWFCLSYFLRTNIKLYCIYQQFFQHHICFPITNETSHVTTHATHSDPWLTLARSTSLFLICCYNYENKKKNNIVEKELLTLPEHMSLYRFLVGFALLDL
jgi:hypothetical protein